MENNVIGRSFTCYEDKATNKTKIESSTLFNIFISAISFGRSATLLFGYRSFWPDCKLDNRPSH